MNLASTLRSFGLQLAASAVFHSGAVTLFQSTSQWGRSRGGVSNPAFAVLLYHRVNPHGDPLFPAISIKAFDAQMHYLARNFRVLSLREIVRRVQEGKTIDPLAVAVTFDDGYWDNFAYAHPILKKYELPATIFVATGFVGSDKLMWNDRLAWSVKHTDLKRVRCPVGELELDLAVESQADKLVALTLLQERLKSCPEDQKNRMLDGIIAAFQANSREPERLMLNWGELRLMAEEGWDVGSHTVSHVILTKVSLSQARDELASSKNNIERELQRPVTLCAFPNGKESDFSAEVIDLAKELNFMGAVTTLSGVNDSASDCFRLRRYSVWETHLPSLACRLSYLYRRGNTYENDQ